MAREVFRWWRVICRKPDWQFSVEMDVYATTEQIAKNTLQWNLAAYLERDEDFRPHMQASEKASGGDGA